jgi:hypothetical protein|tara:strand:- start:139 stop:585 length:447 start_codon:yes stop_codon:yes gene_type:complete
MSFNGNFMCTSFKTELLKGIHNFTASSSIFKLALYTDAGVAFNASTTSYRATNEASGTNYTAGGNPITTITPTATGTTAFVDANDVVFTNVTISGIRGAVFYNNAPVSGGGTPSVAVLDFGSDKAASAGDFTVVMPTADASNAIIRIA